ncbi:MAG: DUF6378 domain-containing protein [Aeromonas veronii]
MNVNWDEAPEGATICADGDWYKEEESYFLKWEKDNWVYVDYSSVYALKDDYMIVHLKEQEPTMTASDFLGAALGHLEDRAATYDSPQGERSMGRTVEAFNAITGHKLSEEQGWLFMSCLKLVRSQQGKYKSDNFEDLIAYGALQGECAAKERT